MKTMATMVMIDIDARTLKRHFVVFMQSVVAFPLPLRSAGVRVC
jgi:hypothetical protein